MSAPREVEWKRATAFHEFASALGCDTGDVLAAWQDGAMFTRDSTNPHAEIFAARLERDEYGILRCMSVEGTGLTVAQMMRGSL